MYKAFISNLFQKRGFVFFAVLFATLIPGLLLAATDGVAEGGHGGIAGTLLWTAVILIVAKMSSLVERLGQPSVLGELVAGVILGNLALIGIHWFDGIKTDAFIPFLAELGVIILLFQVGLESNISQMRKVGIRAFIVAIIGVVVPFVAGFYLAPLLLPGLSVNAYLFIGASLTATSVGITARVFRDLSAIKMSEAQIVLGAAVIDDVLGLIILAVVTAIVTIGAVSLGMISIIVAKAVGFLVAAILLGHFLAPFLGKVFSRIHTGVGMKFALALSVALFFSFAAAELGLAAIVGAFAAGLVLDAVHFKSFAKPKVAVEIEAVSADLPEEKKKQFQHIVEHATHKHVEDLIDPLAHFLVPIFFVYTGITVRLETLFDPKILLVALGLTVIAFIGKYVAGFAAGNVSKSIVGVGMIPRGEVGLIFATIGRQLGVVNDSVFSVVVIMVILSTLLTPPMLTFLIKRKAKREAQPVAV